MAQKFNGVLEIVCVSVGVCLRVLVCVCVSVCQIGASGNFLVYLFKASIFVFYAMWEYRISMTQ